ncbi:PepSY-associated TM helix domain-containing protein [Oceanobacter mangrovi]|uniref:PepSY-associated TM helix domain-containing protein n=1 Tax=Oceanobacter mangrovi TaxID=2862510 RepID=UPI001C8DD5D3|nr:PepSY-associated TM helix domain-containing protein [Oceanobacter mangrovi]
MTSDPHSHTKTSNSGIALGLIRQWHWVSSALCLVGMILFAATGITLNNAAHIAAEPRTTTIEASLTHGLQQVLEGHDTGPLPVPLRRWLQQQYELDIPARDAEWDGSEVYLALPRPGGDAWLSIDLEAGELIYERTDRGMVSLLNDLHKGRNTGVAWSWFLDVFSVTCLIFSLSGLWLLVRYARNRPGTWPMVSLGVLIPLLVIVLTIH